jgi:hypothetical protein
MKSPRQLVLVVTVREERPDGSMDELCHHQEAYGEAAGWNLDDPQLRERLVRHAYAAFDQARNAVLLEDPEA